jgi:hypothetical protein
LKLDIRVQQWEVVVTTLILFNVIPLALALLLLSRIVEAYGTTDWGRLFAFACCCFGTLLTPFAITLNNHLPASCAVVYALYALVGKNRDGVDTPSLSVIRLFIAGFFAGFAACLDLPALAFGGAIAFVLLLKQPRGLLIYAIALLLPIGAQTAINYRAYDTLLPIYAQFGGPMYEYEGSHWEKKRLPPPPDGYRGIDFAEEPKHIYAMN